jgi:hypothetical protein
MISTAFKQIVFKKNVKLFETVTKNPSLN